VPRPYVVYGWQPLCPPRVRPGPGPGDGDAAFWAGGIMYATRVLGWSRPGPAKFEPVGRDGRPLFFVFEPANPTTQWRLAVSSGPEAVKEAKLALIAV